MRGSFPRLCLVTTLAALWLALAAIPSSAREIQLALIAGRPVRTVAGLDLGPDPTSRSRGDIDALADRIEAAG